MAFSSRITILSVLVATLCLSVAYIQAGYWFILLIFPVFFVFWAVQKTESKNLSSSSLLLVYVLLAVVGVRLDLSVLLLATGCTAALACWDLVNFRASIPGDQPSGSTISLEKYHWRSLALASSLGLALIFIGSYVSIQIPFVVTLLLVLIAVGSLTQALHSLAGPRY